MRKIKWENIIGILVGLQFIYCIAYHISRNGFEMSAVGLEVIIYLLVWCGLYTSIYYLRKEL